MVIAATIATSAAAQEAVFSLTMQDGAAENPLTSQSDIEAGRRVFRTSCALCHGGEATGGIGPDLTRGTFRHGSTDAALFRNILTGIPGSDMVGIYRPDSEIWQVVSYIRSLSAGATQVELPGDPQRGREIYLTRGACVDCHRVEGEGSRLGPDLTSVGWLRSPEHIEAALLRPSEFIAFTYRQVNLKTKSGELVSGRLLNEDDTSVQLMDNAENLRAFDKRDITNLDKPEVSMMPAFDGYFNDTDLQDLVSYLYSLKGDS